MQDLVFVVEIVQALDDGLGYLAKDIDTDWANLLGDVVQRTFASTESAIYSLEWSGGSVIHTHSPCIPYTSPHPPHLRRLRRTTRCTANGIHA